MSNIDSILAKYSDVPRSVVLKYEFNRLGIAMSAGAVDAVQDMDLCFKGEFMFSWDSTDRKTLAQKVPWCYHFTRDDTISMNRTNDNSPYVIEHLDGKFFLCEDGRPFEEVYFSPSPAFYHKKTSKGVPMSQIAQSVGDMLFVTINKYCEYFKGDNQCLFCDLTPTGADQAKKGEAASTHRTPEEIVEVLNEAFGEVKPRAHRHLVLSGGTITSSYKGVSDLEYYASRLEAIAKGIRRWYPAAIQMGPPPTREGWQRVKDTGIGAVQPNLEIMDKEKFEKICPGKAKTIGYDEWIRRMIVGAEVFGPGRIVPNFVIGAELSKPYGFTSVDEAVEADLKGFEFLMQNGIMPRLAIWLNESRSKLAGQPPAPLEYYIKLGKGYRQLRHTYGFNDIICGCRGCWPQDTLYDWDYAEKDGKEKARP